jgi:hypothetical protein
VPDKDLAKEQQKITIEKVRIVQDRRAITDRAVELDKKDKGLQALQAM